jgi:hypothetical protein
MHKDLTRMKDNRTKMEKDLRKKLGRSCFNHFDVVLTIIGIDSLQLRKLRHLFVMTISDKLDYAKIDKLRQFANISENKSGKSYAYNPWTQLGAQMEKHMEDMQFAQRRAFDLLRDQVSLELLINMGSS